MQHFNNDIISKKTFRCPQRLAVIISSDQVTYGQHEDKRRRGRRSREQRGGGETRARDRRRQDGSAFTRLDFRLF